ncbi:ankyrin repeat domain-containing protein [Rhodospirillaceae bacterium SYSU D60014]|uniref:ankyrin repeat domain-containing protein n=1 Tax=Virgifigura deserti TaxID=2268457 RepID=UPI000E662E88
MFAASFGISENPFKITPNLRYVYLGENFRNVRAEAKHALSNRNGIVLLTARAGIGKSILLRLLAEDIEAADTASRILSFSCSPGATVDQLFRQALDRFEGQSGEGQSGSEASPESAAETIPNLPRGGDDHLQQLVSDCLAADRPCILLIDEAQNLSDHELGRLFLLVDRVDHHGGRLRMALAGPLEFEDRLGRALPAGFERHIILRRRLEPLPTYEVATFISERLEAAGCRRDGLFSAEAIARIAHYAEGVPRLVNTLCAAALFLAEFESRDSVSADLVDEAARHVELAPAQAEAGARDHAADDADSKALVLAPPRSPPAISPPPESELPSSGSKRLSLPASFDRVDRPRDPDRIEVQSDWMPQPPSSSRLAGSRLAGDELAAERWTSDGLAGEERLADRPSRPWLGLLFGASAAAAVFATLFVLLQEADRFLPFLEDSPELAATVDGPPTTAEPAAPSDSVGTVEERNDTAPARTAAAETAETELPAISAQDEPTPPPAPAIDPDTLAEIGQDGVQGREPAQPPSDAAPQQELAAKSAPTSPAGEAPEGTPSEGTPSEGKPLKGIVAEEAPNGASTQATAQTEPAPVQPAAPEADRPADRTAVAKAAPDPASAAPREPNEGPGSAEVSNPAPPEETQEETQEQNTAPVIAGAPTDPGTDGPDDAVADAPPPATDAAVAESTEPPSPATSRLESGTDEARAEAEPVSEEPPAPLAAETTATEAPAAETAEAETSVAETTVVETPTVESPDTPPAAEAAAIDDLLGQARRQIADLALTTPEGDNAYETYQEVLALAPGHDAALQGFQDIAGKYVELAQSAERKGEESLARRYYAKAAKVAPDYPALPEQRTAALPEPAAPPPEPQPEPQPEPLATTESPVVVEPAAGPAPDAAASGGTPQETLGQLLAQILGEDTAGAPAESSSPAAPPAEPVAPADQTGAAVVAEQARAPASFPMPLSALEGTKNLRAAIAAGADVNTTFNDRRTPLIVAAAQRQTEMVELLLASGADPNAATRALGTPLMYAVWNGDVANVEALLQGGADVNLKNIDGKTALMAAAANGHAQIVDILLRYGAAVNSRTLNGWTPLMYAVWGRHAAVVEQLLERGADISAVNEDGDSAARIAADRGHFEIAAMLRSQQARNQ